MGKGTVCDIDSNIVYFDWARSAEVRIAASFPQRVPAIPVLPETSLQLDVLLQQRAVELWELKRLVLADLGATLQILRAAGREFDFTEERACRVEDCICILGLEECAMAISEHTPREHSSYPGLIHFWEHSRNIALYCKLIAENTGKVNPEQAYLVGLLHGVGSLPALLSWKGAAILSTETAALQIAEHCSAPPCVKEYLADIHSGTRTSCWAQVVDMAHASVCFTTTQSRTRRSMPAMQR